MSPGFSPDVEESELHIFWRRSARAETRPHMKTFAKEPLRLALQRDLRNMRVRLEAGRNYANCRRRRTEDMIKGSRWQDGLGRRKRGPPVRECDTAQGDQGGLCRF